MGNELPQGWSFPIIKDISETIIDCLHDRKPKKLEMGYPFLQVFNIGTNGRLDKDDLWLISQEDFEHWRKRIVPRKYDILITKTGRVGEIAQILDHDEYSFGRNIVLIRPDNLKIDPQYMRFYLKSRVFQKEIDKFTTDGTILKSLHVKYIEKLHVILPPLPEQRMIAHILGSLDDKIELNRHMNETLEGMARALFKSWFVDFDPVRAKAEGRDTGLPEEIDTFFPNSFEDSELGKIPKGWKVSTIGNVVEFAYGKALKASTRKSGDVPVFGSNGCVGFHDEALVKGPGIIIGRKGNPGIVTWSSNDFFPIDTTFYVKQIGNISSMHYLNYSLKAQNLPSLRSDSAVPGLNRNIVYMSEILVPSEKSLTIFDFQIKSLIHCIDANRNEMISLSSLRDTILPKLISGELRVPDVENFIEEVGK